LSVYLVFCFYVFSYDRGIIHRSSKKKRVAKYLENIPAYRAFMSKPSPKARLKENTSEWRLLKFLNDLAYGFLDLSLPRAYHSRTALLRAFFGLDNRSAKFSASDWEKHKKLFSATLTRLRQKGYVVLERKGNRFLWKASKTGKNLFNFNCPENMLLPEDGVCRLFVFDIPESMRHYRDWIRSELVLSGYVLLQKSVWLGKRPLNEKFLQELANGNLFQHVHFFEVKEKGTLHNIAPET